MSLSHHIHPNRRYAVCPRCHRAHFLSLRAPSYCREWLACNFKPTTEEPWLLVECKERPKSGATGKVRNRRTFLVAPGVVQDFASQVTAGLAYAACDLYLCAEENRYLSWLQVGQSVVKPRLLGLFMTEGGAVQRAVHRYCMTLGKPYPYRAQKNTKPSQGEWSLRQLSERARAGESNV